MRRSGPSQVQVRAFAKLNLSLQILSKLPDGYHELRTVFQSVALHDTLSVQHTTGVMRLECDDPACPCDDTNLAWRAAGALWKAAGRTGPAAVSAARSARPARTGPGSCRPVVPPPGTAAQPRSTSPYATRGIQLRAKSVSS